MNEAMVLAAGMQWAYWIWTATIQPGAVRASEKVGDAVGTLFATKIYQWFGEPPISAQGEVDTSEDTKHRLKERALLELKEDPYPGDFIEDTRRALVDLLASETYSMGDLSRYWDKYKRVQAPEWDIRLAECLTRLGDSKRCVATELVYETIRNERLGEFMSEIRQSAQ